MRIPVTGSEGHGGRVPTPMPVAAGHRAAGIDSRLRDGCDCPGRKRPDLAGFDPRPVAA